MFREIGELIGVEGGNHAKDVRVLRGEGEGVVEGAYVRRIDGGGEFVTGQDLAVPVRTLLRRGEGVLGVDAEHDGMKTVCAPSIDSNAFLYCRRDTE